MNIVGRTEDGRAVVDGIFHLYASEGMPLTVLFMMCYERGFQPCWRAFAEDARANGWSIKTIVTRLTEPLTDVWGAAYSQTVTARLQEL